jgi:hypothetical protein
MIPYMGCLAAREMLEAFIDGELPTGDQVVLEGHLRWCATCRARVEDMQLIGASIRLRAAAHERDAADVRATLATMQSDVLTRVRAERDQSFPVQFRGLFDDMRFMWPALGATAALLACLFSSMVVYRATRGGDPESMANAIDTLAKAAAERRPMLQLQPLSSYYPVQLDDSILAPRVLDAGPALYAIGEDEAVFAVSAVVTREGRVAAYELLPSGRAARTRRPTRHAAQVDAVLDSVQHSRFEPAQGAGGGAVTVRVVWVLARTTVKAQAEDAAVAKPPLSDGLARPAPRPARS